MKTRLLRILAFPIAVLVSPYSFITWLKTGKKSITAKLLDFAVLGEWDL